MAADGAVSGLLRGNSDWTIALTKGQGKDKGDGGN
jgi:hypothetical protein